jgi:hypothetical protein
MSEARVTQPRRNSETRLQDPARSTRFRIRIDALGRIVPELELVTDHDRDAATR